MAGESQAKYAMSTAAELTEMHPQTLRKYEREGLLEPSREDGYHRMYSDEDIERLAALRELAQARGVNVAGLRLLMDVRDSVERVEELIEQAPKRKAALRAEIARLRELLGIT